MKRILRLFHTLIHLKINQLVGQVWYRIGGKYVFAVGLIRGLNRKSVKELLFLPFPTKSVDAPDNKFSLLNISHEFVDNNINWEIKKYGMLWAYNLNYMDYLLNARMTADRGSDLLNKYIDSLQQNTIGNDPYPTSLRLVNWIKFISMHKIHNDNLQEAIVSQTKDLLNRIEFHIQGNHLFENYVALVFSAFYLGDRRLFVFASERLETQLKKQILEDGGHYELSPMYHSILLERVLDLINLCQNNKLFEKKDRFLNILIGYAKKMISWLVEMSFETNDYALFNDSAKGISLKPKEIITYARTLGVIGKEFSFNQVEKGLLDGVLGESGYRRINTKYYHCILDIGKIGPDHLPAHSHNDILSFELRSSKGPIIVDPGITNYEKNARRQLERSTVYHNTVFCEIEQADIWSIFRVGRRPKEVKSIIKSMSVDATFYLQNRKAFQHNRKWNFSEDKIEISDSVTGNKKAIAHFYFEAGVKLELQDNTVLFTMGKIVFGSFESIRLETYQKSRGFNKTVNALCIKVDFYEKLSSIIQFKEL